MATVFGDMLRRFREDAEITLGALARHLEVSTPYLSAVERGRKAPLAADKILEAAKFIGANAKELFEAAAQYSSRLTLETENLSAKRAGAALARSWKVMTPDDYERIVEFAERVEAEAMKRNEQ